MISVIIPVYNVEKYLKDCLDSIVNQSYENKEILLIDDGSTDSSPRICEEYAIQYPDIRVIHKKNGGLSSARNRGIKEAKGKWLIFIDSDDILADKDCLTKLHNYAMSLNLDIVRYEYQAVNENLVPFEPRIYNKSCVEYRVLDNYDIVKYAISGEWFAVLYLIRKESISDLKFNERTRFQEDIDFFCRLFASYKLRSGYLNEKFYLYRKRTESITTTYKVGNLKSSFDLCDVFYEYSFKTDDKRLRNLYVYYSVMMYYWTLQTLASEPYYQKRLNIIEELELKNLHNRIKNRVNTIKVEWKYRVFIIPNPSLGVKLLHIKDKIREKIQ